METFDFCPNSQVPEQLPREPTSAITMNGWTFSARPTTPHAHRYRVKLFGLKWYLNNDGTFDSTTDPEINARALEEFYDTHETWAPFNWTHPHKGAMVVRFATPVNIPAGIQDSGGTLEPVEVTLIEHDPGY